MTTELEDRVKRAERAVGECLNYGGVFHGEGPATRPLELAYEQSELDYEVAHMRRFAAALTELADSLEAKAASEV